MKPQDAPVSATPATFSNCALSISKMAVWSLRTAYAPWLLPVLLLLAQPPLVQAQFTFTTNADNTITITGYSGAGGVVTIPDTTNGYPVTCPQSHL